MYWKVNKFLAAGTDLVLDSNVINLSKQQCQDPIIFFRCVKTNQQVFGTIARDRTENLNINIPAKERIANFDIFLSKFHKNYKISLTVVVD